MRTSSRTIILAWVWIAGFLGAGEPGTAADGFRPVDLRAVVNLAWQDDREGDGKGGWTDQGANDMRNVKPGVRTLLGIPFDLIDAATNDGKAVLTLAGSKRSAGTPSAEIAVGAKAASLYFLHTSAWTEAKATMATYTVRYEDGGTVEIPIRAGEEIADWWLMGHKPLLGPASARVALQVTNARFDNLCLFAYGWANPHPEKTIGSVAVKIGTDQGVVLLTAITLSDKPVGLPGPEDVPLAEYLKSDHDLLDETQWFAVEVKRDPFQPTCIDQAPLLGGPAGKHGFLKTVDGRWVFEDGTPYRQIGTYEAWVPEKSEAPYKARQMAKYGFTVLRTGAHLPWADAKRTDTQHLDEKLMDKLDFWINELAKNGVYTRISPMWYRRLKQGDNVEGFDEAIAHLRKTGKLKEEKEPLLNTVAITFFHPGVMEQNANFIKAIMTHRNPYRGNVMYGEDPAICQLETLNEDGAFFATFEGVPPVFAKMLTRQWIDWLRQKYGSDEKLAQAWGDELGGTESLDEGRVGRLSMLSLSDTIAESKPRRIRDQLDFYAGLQNGFFTRTRQMLRDAGVKQPLCGSGWYGGATTFFTDIWANAKGMDYIDRHHYYAGEGMPSGWHIAAGFPFKTECALRQPELLLKLGGERVMGMPYSISEWANVLPNQFRLEAPPLMTFYGMSLGGWDAPYHFGWSPPFEKLGWIWPVGEPSTLCQYPALSRMVRQGDLKPGPDAYVRNLSDAELLSGRTPQDALIRLDISGPFIELSSAHGANPKSLAATYAAAVGRTGIAFTGAEEKPDESLDLNQYMDLDKREIRSATGELYWNYGQGYVTADAPRMQAAVGFLADTPVKLMDCEIRTSNLIASILVSPLDDQPLARSKHLLVTAVGRTRNTGMAYARGGTRLVSEGQTPIRHEGIKGTVTLKRSGACTIVALDPYGYKTVDVAPRPAADGIEIPMDGQNRAVYYEVVFP